MILYYWDNDDYYTIGIMMILYYWDNDDTILLG